MAPLFWIIATLDAVLFVGLLVAGLTAKGISDGGREMSLFFYVIVPAIVIGGAVLLFVKSESAVWRFVALLIVAGPGLLLATTRIRSAVIDYQVRQNAEGSGYFSGRNLKAAGKAVVGRDTSTLRAVAKRIDVNAKGAGGMTLMELAVTQAWESPPKDSAASGAASPDVVRELLSLGADPNPGLEIATKTRDTAVISALLAAGAKPDYANDRGPVAFEWIGVTPVANFTALLDHKLDVNIIDRFGTPLIIAAAEHDRWDLVLLLMARGADASRVATNGTHLSDVVQSRVESTTDRPAEMKADIARVKAQLSASPARTSR